MLCLLNERGEEDDAGETHNEYIPHSENDRAISEKDLIKGTKNSVQAMNASNIALKTIRSSD